MTGPDSSKSSHIPYALICADESDEAKDTVSLQMLARPISDLQVLSSRLELLSKIFAVDDALLYSSVRRAIEDRYPRYKHHAGLSPILESLADITPGGNMVKVLGRWIVGRLLRPRNER